MSHSEKRHSTGHTVQPPNVTSVSLEDDGTFPNNANLPVIVHWIAAGPAAHAVSAMESVFQQNGWSGTRRNGIYGYHHYHSMAHKNRGVNTDFLVIGAYPEGQDRDTNTG